MRHQRGLTLLELLVVLAIIGFAMTGVSLSLRDNGQNQLAREAQRLIAILEAARAQSRTSGVPWVWQVTPEGFVVGPVHNPAPRPSTWLAAGTQATISSNASNLANAVVLGPEPLLSPTRITLTGATAGDTRQASPARSLTIGTQGLRPFEVLP
jgi:general secretion pathway protein H